MPGKLLLQLHISLSAHITGPSSSLSWATHAFSPDLNAAIAAHSARATRMLLGRKLAEGFIPHWAAHPELPGAEEMNALSKTVVSSTLEKVPEGWEGDVEVVGGELKDVVARLKAGDEGGDIISYGGAETAQALVAKGLVDELFLIVEPVSLERGVSLFTTRADYVLVSVRAFECGVSLAHYRLKK